MDAIFVSPSHPSSSVQSCKITISIVEWYNTRGKRKCWFMRLSDWLVNRESVSSRQTQDLSLGAGPLGSDPHLELDESNQVTTE